MITLFHLTKKNLKLLFRSRGSALVVIFAPLLIVLLLGLSYNTSGAYGINIGVFSPSSTDANDFGEFTKILEQEEFSITKYEKSIDECLEDMKRGQTHTCLTLPANLKVEDNVPKEIIFHVDPSRINLVWMIQETLQSKFNIKSAEISKELTSDLLSTIDKTRTGIDAQKVSAASASAQSGEVSGINSDIKTKLTALDSNPIANKYDSTLINATLTLLATAQERNNAAMEAKGTDENSTDILSRMLKDTRDALVKIDTKLRSNTSTNVTIGEGVSIESLVNGIQADINLANAKLAAAASVIRQASANIDTGSAKLQTTTEDLGKIQESLDEMSKNLAGIKVTEAGTVAAPITMKVEKVAVQGTYLSYLFPALLILVIMFSSLPLGTTLVMIEKNNPAFFRNFFLPVRKVTFIASIYLTNLVLILIQIAVILGISMIFLRDSYAQLPYVALILFIAASLFTFIGMAVGYVFTSEETGVLASISLGSVFLLISGVIFPLEGVSAVLRKFVVFNPFVIAEKLVRQTFLFKAGINEIYMDLLILLTYAVVMFLGILIMETLLHKHLSHKFLKTHHKRHKTKDAIKNKQP